MKCFFACCLVLSTVFLYEAAPLNQAVEIEPKGFDPLLDLLPLYGHLKLKYFFSIRQWNTIAVRFIILLNFLEQLSITNPQLFFI